MTARGLAWVVGLGGLAALGCGGAAGTAAVEEAAGPPAVNARAMLDEARRELADPERAPLREGMRIDREALRQALVRLRAQHGAQVAVAYGAGVDALPTGERPTPPRFVEVAAFSLPSEPAAREVEALNWLLDVDVRQTVKRVVATYLTLLMHGDVGMTTEDIGVWMAFLRAAEPALLRCGEQGDAGLVLCLDYGADVFVLEVDREGPAWVVTRLRWMQASKV